MDQFLEGRQAYISGKFKLPDNPYFEGSSAYQSWNLGFMQGMRIMDGGLDGNSNVYRNSLCCVVGTMALLGVLLVPGHVLQVILINLLDIQHFCVII